MNKIKNSKGFTLMEMLIVVAIIAVLVAIAIPTFTTSLNKASWSFRHLHWGYRYTEHVSCRSRFSPDRQYPACSDQ